jgi:hypothetical protein
MELVIFLFINSPGGWLISGMAMRKLPKVHAQDRMFAFEYNLHNMESSLPQYHLISNNKRS